MESGSLPQDGLFDESLVERVEVPADGRVDLNGGANKRFRAFEPDAVMAEAAHGTAPSLRGKNVANPMAMILAGAALLAFAGERAAQPSRAIREACLEAVADGVRTADLGGHVGTSEFTDEVIRRVRSKLEVWSTL